MTYKGKSQNEIIAFFYIVAIIQLNYSKIFGLKKAFMGYL